MKPPSNQAEKSEMVTAAAVDALQVITADVDQFLLCWLDRLSRTVVSQQPLPTTDSQLRERMREFRHQQAEWEEQRQREEQEIKRKLDEITAAWLRLEVEQRKLLQAKELQVHEAQTNGVYGEAVSAAATAYSENSESEQVSSVDFLSPNANQRTETTVLQFQRLRREIESSRPPVK